VRGPTRCVTGGGGGGGDSIQREKTQNKCDVRQGWRPSSFLGVEPKEVGGTLPHRESFTSIREKKKTPTLCPLSYNVA